MPDLIQVFLLAMTPLGELRLAIPVGLVVLGQNAIPVFVVAVAGNMVPVVLLLLFFKKISSYHFNGLPFVKKAIDWWQTQAHTKHSKKIEKYGALGLMLFVAVPLPLTGAWTGALLAVLMNLPFKRALAAIFGGVAIAGLLVVLAVTIGINIQEYAGWQVLLGFALFAVVIYLYLKKYRKYE